MKRLTLTILMSAAFLGMDARTNEPVFEYCNNQKDAQELKNLSMTQNINHHTFSIIRLQSLSNA